jgi:hypothetical protein
MTTDRDDPFETALAALLAPLAQAMVARGVTLGAATEALKKALLEAALASDSAAISDSKASLLTGLHRKDVKRLRSEESQTTTRRRVNVTALVISTWATAPDYQDHDGTPRVLARLGDDTHPGFDDLVKQTRADMAPGTILSALLDQGLVEQTPEGALRLLSHTLVPATGTAEQVAAYQATLSAHLMAATQNLLGAPDSPRHFDRAVRYSHLTEASVTRLTTSAADKAQALLETLNAEARALQKQDADVGPAATGKFVLGAYILPTSPTPSSDTEDQT